MDHHGALLRGADIHLHVGELAHLPQAADHLRIRIVHRVLHRPQQPIELAVVEVLVAEEVRASVGLHEVHDAALGVVTFVGRDQRWPPTGDDELGVIAREDEVAEILDVALPKMVQRIGSAHVVVAWREQHLVDTRIVGASVVTGEVVIKAHHDLEVTAHGADEARHHALQVGETAAGAAEQRYFRRHSAPLARQGTASCSSA